MLPFREQKEEKLVSMQNQKTETYLKGFPSTPHESSTEDKVVQIGAREVNVKRTYTQINAESSPDTLILGSKEELASGLCNSAIEDIRQRKKQRAILQSQLHLDPADRCTKMTSWDRSMTAPVETHSIYASAPRTKAEAREHIAAIKTKKGVDRPSTNMKDLEAALELISNNLYQKPTRFVMELIQNADDNSYARDTKPKMKINYHAGTLRFDTNETGFRRADVEAICSIGHSSKLVSRHRGGHIGEKGIGFKSVFKVSDEVFINSGYYSFKFTNKEPLGRLVPIWADFPKDPLPGFTSILLVLSSQWNVKKMIEELQNLDARLLIFLKTLKEVEISISEHHMTASRILHRQDTYIKNSNFRSLILQPDKFSPYILSHYDVFNIPGDERRRGHSRTGIMLGFPSNISYPVKAIKLPSIEKQQVYAYLPIRDYGFKFLLNADFILVANREDIESDSTWNRALLQHIPHAILDAINQFNQGEYRFSWLQYVPFKYDSEDFFHDVGLKTMQLLCKQPILESLDRILMAPSGLALIPEALADKNGDSLIPPGDSKFVYVSRRYPLEASYALELLGIKCISAEEFLDDLSNFVRIQPKKFWYMPVEWHARLCAVLEPLYAKFETYISSLPLIPLRQGLWITPKDSDRGTLFFPHSSVNITIPHGIQVFEVHFDAATEPARRRLLRKFKARDANTAEVCRIILKTHASEEFRPETLKTADLVSHVVFLYNSGWKPLKFEQNLWVKTQEGALRRSSQVYMASSELYSASHLFAEYKHNFHFLCVGYFEALSGISSKEDWKEWLRTNINVVSLPRLVRYLDREQTKFTINDDFRFLMNRGYLDVLQLLRLEWQYYSPWFLANKGQKDEAKTLDAIQETPEGQLRHLLSIMNVSCFDGSTVRLSETSLPRKTVLEGIGITIQELISNSESLKPASYPFPLLSVPSPEQGSWDFLEIFGVIIKMTPRILVNQLRQLQRSCTTKEQVSLLYDRLQACVNDEDIGYIRRAFKEHNLVFVPVGDKETTHISKWFSMDDCVWEGPTCLEKIPRLAHYYPSQKPLFCDKLGLPHATLKTIVTEAQKITSVDSLAHIRDVFIKISHMVQGAYLIDIIDSRLDELSNCEVFPIWTGKNRPEFDCLRNAHQDTENDSWYIADLPYLLDSFVETVPLLAFEMSDIQEMAPMMEYLPFGCRKLSKIATKEPVIRGQEWMNSQYTEFMRRKAEHISRLVPSTNSNRDAIISDLGRMIVYQAEEVSMAWKFDTLSGETISGRSEEGRVMLAPGPQNLKMYLISEDMEIGRPPLELTEELSNFCGIKRPEHISLLTHILIQDDDQRIKQDLQRRGISGDTSSSKVKVSDIMSAENQDQIDSIDHKLVETAEILVSPPVSPMQEEVTENIDCEDPSAQTSQSGYILRCSENMVYHESSQPRRNMKYERHELLSLSMPVPLLGSTSHSEESKFNGECSVSAFFKNILQEEYSPNMHWTSCLRNRAGHQPYLSADLSVSTFTIKDTSGRLIAFLSQKGCQQARCFSETPTFHIQVAVSGGSVNSNFDLPSEQVKKAKRLTLAEGRNPTRKDLFILILVFNLYKYPRLAFFADPWQLHRNGVLSLETFGEYEACFNDTVSSFYEYDFSKALKATAGDKCFPYQALGIRQIRLLELLPGEPDTPLKGIIRHVSLSSPGKFWTISYVWGDDPVMINGASLETPMGQLTFPASLGSALSAIRESKAPVMIWADSICINQASSREKVLQIPITDSLPNKRILRSDDEIWSKINSFVDRPWFQRAWIVQELVLSSKVFIMCGRSMMNWDHFFEALKISEMELNLDDCGDPEKIQVLPHAGPAYSLGLTRHRLRCEGRRYRLLDLLELFAHTKATINRDKLFSLLGVSCDASNEGFIPDYDSSFEDVVRRFAKGFILDKQVMDLLYRAGVCKSYSFCSWIPEWTRDIPTQTISTWKTVKGAFSAGQGIPFAARIISPSVLAVRGFLFDAIMSTNHIKMGTRYKLSFVDAMTDFHRLLQCVTNYPTGESREDILLRLPIGNARQPHLESTMDRLRSYRGFTKPASAEKWPNNLRDLVFSFGLDLDPVQYHNLPSETWQTVANYWQTAAAFSNRISGAIFCVTKRTFVGLVPAVATAGDEICLLHGSKVPFLIRRRGPRHILIGECYIHGIMHGEGLRNRLEETTFYLE